MVSIVCCTIDNIPDITIFRKIAKITQFIFPFFNCAQVRQVQNLKQKEGSSVVVHIKSTQQQSNVVGNYCCGDSGGCGLPDSVVCLFYKRQAYSDNYWQDVIDQVTVDLVILILKQLLQGSRKGKVIINILCTFHVFFKISAIWSSSPMECLLKKLKFKFAMRSSKCMMRSGTVHLLSSAYIAKIP